MKDIISKDRKFYDYVSTSIINEKRNEAIFISESPISENIVNSFTFSKFPVKTRSSIKSFNKDLLEPLSETKTFSNKTKFADAVKPESDNTSINLAFSNVFHKNSFKGTYALKLRLKTQVERNIREYKFYFFK